MLAGVYAKDAGRILYKGKEADIQSPRAAQHLGISMIHQELNLMPHLTVAQNIFIGREPRRGLPFLLDERAVNARAREYLERLHLDLDPRVRLADLTVAKQQMVEIAKALSFKSKLIIMDEPSSSLTGEELVELAVIIKQLKERGISIIYISHKLAEIFDGPPEFVDLTVVEEFAP